MIDGLELSLDRMDFDVENLFKYYRKKWISKL